MLYSYVWDTVYVCSLALYQRSNPSVACQFLEKSSFCLIHHILPTTYYPPHITNYIPPATYHQLHTTHHIPPITYHASNTTHHIPPTTYHPPNIYHPTYTRNIWYPFIKKSISHSLKFKTNIPNYLAQLSSSDKISPKRFVFAKHLTVSRPIKHHMHMNLAQHYKYLSSFKLLPTTSVLYSYTLFLTFILNFST